LRIAAEAAKRCGRGLLPAVYPTVSFSEMLECIRSCDLVLFCYEGDGTRSLREVLDGAASSRNACVIVGSEGGFSPKEAEAAKSAGLVSVNLGPRILRCETAPLYALAALSYRFEL
jgi:16S rRNA (uracil1498-N3)-methyltransferase